MTTTNALRFLFDHVGTPQTRKLLLLQNASFLPLFREAMKSRGQIGDSKIDALVAVETNDHGHGRFDLRCCWTATAAGGRECDVVPVIGQNAETLMNAARRLIFLKGTDAHDYKFSTAALEDYYKISPAVRNQFMAASMYNLKGTSAAGQSTRRSHPSLTGVKVYSWRKEPRVGETPRFHRVFANEISDFRVIIMGLRESSSCHCWRSALPVPAHILNSPQPLGQGLCILRFAVHHATFDFASRSDSSDGEFVARIRSAGNPCCLTAMQFPVRRNEQHR